MIIVMLLPESLVTVATTSPKEIAWGGFIKILMG